jgi:hypothetical protein
MKYTPQQFSDLYSTKVGQDIWKCLNEHDNIIRMETASLLKRPAVEPMSEILVDRFDKDVREDRTKQMIGHMVRQIMEDRGFALNAHNIVIRFGDLFSRGSRYKRSN